MHPWAAPMNAPARGLSHEEVLKRQKQFGLNQIEQQKGRSAFGIFIAQFLSPLIAVLVVASGISFVLGDHTDTYIILAIVFINALLGFWQEFKAEKTVQSLRQLISPKVKVLRNGKRLELDSKFLVPGDVVFLNIGDLIPADLRLVKVDGLTVDEAPLTGESLPVVKTTELVADDHHLPQQLLNMAFMGTAVSSGEGMGVVVSTGKETFFGKISSYLKEPEEKSDFDKSVSDFSRFLLKVILLMTAFIFLVNAVLDHGWLESFLFALALAVGITPEQLPIIITISLSRGAEVLAKAKVVVKKLTAIEDLGNMDILCTDKTGTLTEGHLQLQNFFDATGKEDPLMLVYGLLCSDEDNMIDRAILASKDRAGAAKRAKSYKLVDRNEFDFQRRRMSVVVQGPNKKKWLIVKGAVESLEKISKVPKGFRTLIEGHREAGFNTIAIAIKEFKGTTSTQSDERGLTLVGFLTFLDPPRESAKTSIDQLERLGVAVKVLSGDDPLVTRAVCKQVGLTIVGGKIYTGDDLDKFTHARFVEVVNKYNVFSRIAPEHKYKIVKALNRGEKATIAFMGDGINDAPALKVADVGISVNTATDIAKDAADIILLQKNLQVVVDGVVLGRKIFANIRKYILNTVSANYGNMFTVALSSMFLKFVPLLPSQILLNNLVTDTPMLAISTDNVDEEVQRRPSKLNVKVIRSFMTSFGLLSTAFDLLLIFSLIYYFKTGPELFRSAWFLESALSEMIITFSLRTYKPFWKSRPGQFLLGLSIVIIGLLFAFMYIPSLAGWFQLVPLPQPLLLWCLGVVGLYFIACELFKLSFFRRDGVL
jgi:Mg2+-importing ATPase